MLQHKDNPVDWWPWSDAAFAAAAAEDKPVFLSVGYATCHWCHVMEHESFEDPAVAALMNEAFVNVKVDREERPDIDTVYMTVCQMVTQRGGWPLTIIMTPDKRPFFVATYIPKHSIHGRMGMLDLIPRVAAVWRNQRSDVTKDAERTTSALLRITAAEAPGDPDEGVLHQAFSALRSSFDPTHGGFGGAPKFPSPTQLRFLLRYWKRTGQSEALLMVGQTLAAMRNGGIYDHIGWGFHRYATDASWTVPHFEKMLYDQAMLALTYTEAFQAIGEELFAETAHEILRYVLRDMTSPEGGFYSAEDADSEGKEGKFYVWTHAELGEVLSDHEVQLLEHVYNVQHGGNFRDEATGQRTGENILYRSQAGALDTRLDAIRQKLFARRTLRVRPLKDDKVLTDWNGLMIAAMARAARVFDEPLYADAAARAAAFVQTHLTREGCQLLHRWRNGAGGIAAFLDDYAYMIWGLVELYETTFDVQYLRRALHLTGFCRKHFRADDGAYYLTSDNAEALLVRTRPFYDGPVPSGNAIMMMNLLRLSRLLGDPALARAAWNIARAHAGALGVAPTGLAAMLSALEYALGPSAEVVIAGVPEAADTQAMLRALRTRYLPGVVTMLRPTDDPVSEIAALVPALAPHTSIDGKATAYVCTAFACQSPATDVAGMLQAVKGVQLHQDGPS